MLAMAGGCASQAELGNGPIYPEEKRITAVVDIQVLRDETEITMTNTTTRTFAPARAWVNQWWCADFPGLTPGQTIKLDLSNFKDCFGDAFRAGGFFATQNPDALVKFEVEEEAGLVGFIVIGQ